MVITLNLFLLLKLLLLPLIYVVIIYLTAPNKTLNLKIAGLCFLAGILSTNFVQIYYAIFDVMVTSNFDKYFFSVAPREEISKLLAYLCVILSLKNRNIHPLSLMYYSGIVGLGFATFENFMYGMMYGEDIIIGRSFTATFGHLIFGLFLGYWVGLGKVDLGKYGNRSLFGFYMYKFKKLKMCIYTIIGLLCAIMYHGLWNYNLSVSWVAASPIMILMIIFGLTISKFASTDLYNHHRKSLKK
tara:strand:+ start:449 stop:1177 length:729 start_codon:yes stop_codon:yes gene_type:complete